MRTPSIALALAVTVAASLVSAPAAGGAAAADPYWVPPALDLAGRPGEVIRSRPVDAALYPDANVTQVMYRSTSARGAPVAVTGIVLVPRTAHPGDRPLVVLTPGTRGIADHCAPSRQFTADQADPRAGDFETGTIRQFLSRGFAVAVTDYEGNGTPGLSSYIVGRSEGYNGLDVARAAQRLGGSGLSPRGPVGVVGYSQGGQAAAWAGELAPTYAPELNVTGILSGGGPADVGQAVDFVNGNPTAGAGFGLAVLSGYGHAYPELGLDEKLTPEGERVMARVREGACTAEYLTAFGTTSSADVTRPDVLTLPAWRQRFRENLLGTVVPGAPAYLFHGTADTIVEHSQSVGLYQRWCARGASVEFESQPGVEHLAGVYVGPLRGIQWLTARLDGEPGREGCHMVG